MLSPLDVVARRYYDVPHGTRIYAARPNVGLATAQKRNGPTGKNMFV